MQVSTLESHILHLLSPATKVNISVAKLSCSCRDSKELSSYSFCSACALLVAS